MTTATIRPRSEPLPDGLSLYMEEMGRYELLTADQEVELAQTIEAELDEPEAVQLELFQPVERDQLQRNVQALRARLAQIPGEIEAEKAAIAARYADPQPRMFPVAVTFLVPERLDR